MTDKTFKDYLKEDSVDMEKHNTLNDIFQALERLNTEVDELDALDSDMDSTGVGDLNDQLTTFRKHISALYQVLDRAGRIVPMESVNEAVDQELMDQVIVQIKRDCDMGDYTAIEELLMSCPEENLRGFLSDIEESAELNELKKLSGLQTLTRLKDPELPKQDRTGMGTGTDVPLGGFPKQDRTGMGTGTDVILDPDELPQGPARMPEPTEKPRSTYPDGTPLPSGTPMPDNLPDIPKDAYRDLFKKPMKVPPMSNDLNLLRRRAGIK